MQNSASDVSPAPDPAINMESERSGELTGGDDIARRGWLQRWRDFIVPLRRKLRQPVPADRLLPEQL